MDRWDIRTSGIPVRGLNNLMLTQGLFYEFLGDSPIYTLKPEDIERKGKLLPSVYKIYMDSADEYEAAMRIVGSMQHWRKLCSLDWFLNGAEQYGWEGIASARLDMQARDKSLAKGKLLEAINEGNVTAMRILYGEAAPKKAEPKKKLKTVDSSVNAEILADIKRIRGD